MAMRYSPPGPHRCLRASRPIARATRGIARARCRLHDPLGNDWLPAGEIQLRRSYTFSESQVLARGTQEERLLKEMQTDAVQQLIRRLQAAKKPA